MSPGRRSKDVRISIDYKEIKEFLTNLAEDVEGFRTKLQEDPRATLLDYRIDVSAETLPAEITLPDPQATRDYLKEIEEQYEGYPEEAAYVLGYGILAHVLIPAPSPPPSPSA